jgi:hypothetical protein
MKKEKLYEVILIFLLILSLFLSVSLAIVSSKTGSIETTMYSTTNS